jgi:SAM-dependent methyltransferase
MKPDQPVSDKWSGVAPFWEKYRGPIMQLFAPVSQALIEDAGVGEGDAVLDVATGPGEPALTVAARVGSQGKVVGVDPAAPMVAAARRAAEQGGFRNAQFEVGSADSLPFAPDSFDAVVSRFGAMYFPSPGGAVREMLRVVRPGRKVSLAVWGSQENNPFFSILLRVFERYVDPTPSDPQEPDQFRFAAEGTLRNIFDEAGGLESSDRLLRFTMQAPISVEEFWTLRCEISDKLRDKVARLSADQVADARREGIAALRPYSTAGGMQIPAQVRIVTGTKRGSVSASRL